MYDFTTLSSYEFEQLVHDLAEASTGLKLEAFTSGRDNGIDLRSASPTNANDVVIQAKHYAGSGWHTLVSNLRKESTKVRLLKPTRYVLATSVGLTPDNKTEIASIFAPFILSTADVMGRDDLNAVLRAHSAIEQRHFKLWLTSAAVLARALHAKIFSDTDSLLSLASDHTRLYVSNPSYNRAVEVLNKAHACIIAGIPGIGKSMLAEMLLISHASDGFEPVLISEDISEGNDVFKETGRQIFYYDDFLGKTGSSDRQLSKNEDARILRFIQRVHRHPEKRLVLTTREYILADARLRHEALSDAQDTLGTCIVDLSDYTARIRASILYNHLYFSTLPQELREALLPEKRYLAVIQHPNYNPRLIEKVVQLSTQTRHTPAAFVEFLFETLNSPARLWNAAFESLSDERRAVLLVLSSMPAEPSYEDLYIATSGQLQSNVTSATFRRAVGVLENTFLSTDRVDGVIFVDFHNPSILDYVTHRLDQNYDELASTILGAQFFDQIEQLCRRVREVRPTRQGAPSQPRHPGLRSALTQHGAAAMRRAQALFDSPSARFHTSRDHRGRHRARAVATPAARIAALYRMSDVLGVSPDESWVADRIAQLAEGWRALTGDKDGCVGVLSSKAFIAPEALLAAKVFLLDTLETGDDFQNVVEVYEARADMFEDEEIEQLRSDFLEFAGSEEEFMMNELEDPDEVRAALEAVAGIGERLGVGPGVDDHLIKERIAELELDRRSPDSYDGPSQVDGDYLTMNEAATIDSIFDTLKR